MSSIQAQRQGDVLTLVFSRPEAGNSFGLDDARLLQKILRSNKSARVLVWRSRGRFFCAGGDLAAYSKMTKRSQGLLVNKQITAVLDELAKFPGITLAIVEGDCFGGGMELLSCFDVVWSVPFAAFGIWQRRIGLSYGWGGGHRLEKRTGFSKLKVRALGSESFTAFTAKELGFVDRIVSANEIPTALEKWLESQERLAHEPVGALKSMTAAKERSFFQKLWGNPHHSDVLRKFRMKMSGKRP